MQRLYIETWAIIVLSGDLIQLFRLNDLTVQCRISSRTAKSHGHQGGVVHHRNIKLSAELLIDLILIDFGIHLTHRAGRDDHIGAIVHSRLQNGFAFSTALVDFHTTGRMTQLGEVLMQLSNAAAYIGIFSTSITCLPASAASKAALIPLIPPPTTSMVSLVATISDIEFPPRSGLILNS